MAACLLVRVSLNEVRLQLWQYIGRKCAYGRLQRTYQLRDVVDYKPIGLEFTGGMGSSALNPFNDIVAFVQLPMLTSSLPLSGHGRLKGFSSYCI